MRGGDSPGLHFRALVFSPASARLCRLAGALRRPHRRRPAAQVGCRAGGPNTRGWGARPRVEAWPGFAGGLAGTAAAALASLLLACGPALATAPGSQAPEPARTGREELVAEAASVSRSAVEEGLTLAFQRLEARLDAALASIAGSLPGVGGAASQQAAAAAEREGRELVQEVWEVVAKKYLDARGSGFDQAQWAAKRDAALAKPLRDKPAAYRAIKQMLAEGLADPYTRFITAAQFEAMQAYDITGVGLNLCTASELEEKTDLHAPQPGLYVLGLISSSAASQAGIQQGDQILAVGGQPVSQQSPFQAAALLSGRDAPDAEPSVAVTVRKAGSEATQEVRLQRPQAAQQPSPVQAQLLDVGGRKVGRIRLQKFVARTQPDVAAALRELTAAGAQEFQLDLRDNLGGLVEEGVEVARLFLDGDVTIVNRLDNEGWSRKTAAGSAALSRAPLAVLVNERTASASEILAGALRDNCRAVLVGHRTYGKGLIQGVFQLEDGSALAVTIGKYLTPAKTDIDREGLLPDFGSPPPPAAAAARLAACRVPTAA